MHNSESVDEMDDTGPPTSVEWSVNLDRMERFALDEDRVRMVANGFQVSIPGGEYNLGMGIFDAAACLNHSCDANVMNHFKMEEGVPPVMELKALRDLRKAEEITLSYIQIDTCTQNRREMCWEQYRFVCECPKCQDPLRDAHAEGYLCPDPACVGRSLSLNVGVRRRPATFNGQPASHGPLTYDKVAPIHLPKAFRDDGVGNYPPDARYCLACASEGPFAPPRAVPTLKNGDVYWLVDGRDVRSMPRGRLEKLANGAHAKSAFRLAVGQQLVARILEKDMATTNKDMVEAAKVQKLNVETSAYLHYQNHPLIHDEMDKFVKIKMEMTQRKIKDEVGMPRLPNWMQELLNMAQGGFF